MSTIFRQTNGVQILGTIALRGWCWVLCLPLLSQAAELDLYRPSAISTEGIPTIPPTIWNRLQQYQSIRAARFRGWSPDGRGLLIQTQFGNTVQLHRVYEPGGRREQLTFHSEPVDGQFIPKHPRGALWVQYSQGGDENTQCARVIPGHPWQMWTDGRARHVAGPIFHTGTMAAVGSNRRSSRDTDWYIVRLDQPDDWQEVLRVDHQTWYALDWSRDGRWLLMQQYISINQSRLALLEISTRTLNYLPSPTGSDEPVAFGVARFLPNSREILLSVDARGEFLELARFSLDQQQYVWLAPDIAADVEGISIDPLSGNAVVCYNLAGLSQLYLWHEDQRHALSLPPGIYDHLEFSPDGQELGFTWSRLDGPADVYSYHLATQRLTRWTYSELGGLSDKMFIAPVLIEYPTFDGRQIPAWVFLPQGSASEEAHSPTPVLIQIHGGPESQYRPHFSPRDQAWLQELGIAIIWPNVRGSRGYGKTYLKLDDRERREDSVRDIVALLDWIESQPRLDSRRVAVMGGSYGGYMTLATAVHASQRIRAAVDIVGIANFVSFLEHTSPYRRDLRRAEYGDERDPQQRAFLERISPVYQAEQIRCPLFVIHGRNDPRVPLAEAEQIVPKVRNQGVEVWTLYADNEGHGFRKRENVDYMTAAITVFLQRHLGIELRSPRAALQE
ncbi:MAG: peptidase S9 family protein [Planctomycetaceae bacterium]|nr:MAG: peptidase S9 family protein [Planctomycetaceae bacterium]